MASSRYQIRRSSLMSDERDACSHKTKAVDEKIINRKMHNKVKKYGEHRTETRTRHGCGKPDHCWRDCASVVDSEHNKRKRSRVMFTV